MAVTTHQTLTPTQQSSSAGFTETPTFGGAAPDGSSELLFLLTTYPSGNFAGQQYVEDNRTPTPLNVDVAADAAEIYSPLPMQAVCDYLHSVAGAPTGFYVERSADPAQTSGFGWNTHGQIVSGLVAAAPLATGLLADGSAGTSTTITTGASVAAGKNVCEYAFIGGRFTGAPNFQDLSGSGWTKVSETTSFGSGPCACLYRREVSGVSNAQRTITITHASVGTRVAILVVFETPITANVRLANKRAPLKSLIGGGLA